MTKQTSLSAKIAKQDRISAAKRKAKDAYLVSEMSLTAEQLEAEMHKKGIKPSK